MPILKQHSRPGAAGRSTVYTMTAISPTLPAGFVPPWPLRPAHVQAVLASLGWRSRVLRRRAAAMLEAARPEILELEGVRLLGYHSPRPSGARGLVIVLHGWEGSVDSHYAVALGGRTYAEGFEVFRLNFRDHGGTVALNEGLFHSCRLDEVVAAVREIARRHPSERTYLVGYSLGGNFALRVAASEAAPLLSKVVAVCPVLHPPNTMRALETGLWIYREYFLRRWRESLAAKAAAFPERYDFGDLRRFPTLTETTRFFVERYTRFEDLDAYLNGYSLVGDRLARLGAPAWLLAARDDPVIPSEDLGALARSDALEITLTAHGGHCAYLADLRLGSWLEGRILAALGSG